MIRPAACKKDNKPEVADTLAKHVVAREEYLVELRTKFSEIKEMRWCCDGSCVKVRDNQYLADILEKAQMGVY